MKILSVNAGSSSLKFTMFEMPEEKVLVNGTFEKIGLDDGFYTIKLNGEKIVKEMGKVNHGDAVDILLDELQKLGVIKDYDEIKGVGHRMVHGGDKYADSVILTEEVLKTVSDLIPLAPLHNPANLTGVSAFMEAMPTATQVGVFDTAFHQTMTTDVYLYAVPYEWYTEYGVRKYGFHGTSHKFLMKRLQEITGKENGKFITCHLGNGGSISAIKDGKCVNTSMGFTPNAGLVMGSRSGDIDATIIPYVMEQTGKTVDEIMNDLNKNSGFLGITGKSSDSRDVQEGINEGDPRCILAQQMYVNMVAQYIASYYVELGGCDALCFAGGVGENSINSRKEILEAISVLGVKIDKEANDVRGVEKLITTEDSSFPCYIVPTDEELMIARDTYDFIK